jgi:hypothetical protein
VVGNVSALAALCGAGVGLGLVLAICGWRGVEVPRPTRRLERHRVERANLRVGLAVGAAVVVGAATGWPVGAVLAGLAAWGAPGLLGGAKRHSMAVGRIEAIAGWAEMLRDTMAGSAGLEQAIVATAPSPPSRSEPRSPPWPSAWKASVSPRHCGPSPTMWPTRPVTWWSLP